MDITRLRRWRRPSLVLFAVGFIAVVGALFFEGHALFLLTALVTFASLGFFVFTEGFLFSPPERGTIDVWIARLFFVVIVLAILYLAVELVGAAL